MRLRLEASGEEVNYRMLVAFLFLCFFARRIAGYERNFCGYIEDSEEEFWSEICTAQDAGRDTDSASHHGVKSTDTEPHMFKWMAFYHTEGPVSHQQERCGGVLISDSAVLTAAHCLHSDGETAHVTSVTLGVHDIQNPGDSLLEIPVERTVIHEHFNRTGNLEYDVGILLLREEIVWTHSTKIRPICLPTGSETNQYAKATVTGWGFSQGDKAAATLQQGDMTVYDQQTCSHIFNRTLDSGVELCGGSLNHGSACKGDSGGPVISRRPNQLQYEVIGIIGEGNCVSSLTSTGTRYASVFTKIAEDRILNWIHAELMKTSCPAKINLARVLSEKAELERILGDRDKEIQQLKERYNETSMTSTTTTATTATLTTTATKTSPTTATATTEIHSKQGKVLLMGGFDSVGFGSVHRLASVESYGNCTDNTEDLPVPTNGASAAVLGGSVYLCGGMNSSGSTSTCYIRVGSQWTTGPNMVKERSSLSLNTVGDRLVAVGGIGAAGAKNTVEVLDPVTHTWTLQSNTLDVSRYQHCAITMSDTTLMLIGGWFSLTTQLQNIDTGSVTQYSDLPFSGRIKELRSPACGLYNHQILVIGGHHVIMATTSQVFTLDPSNTGNPWISAGRMVKARRFHTMEILNGVPTVFGGWDEGKSILDIEELLPDGTWKNAGSLSQARDGHASVTIPC